MSIDDVFLFIPNLNDDSHSEDMLLYHDREDNQLNGKFFGIIKTGNKCVPPSKVNPKQRRGIATISSDLATENNGYTPTADRILWSDYKFDVKRLARRPRDDFPIVIKVVAESPALTEAELSAGCNLLVHVCRSEERIIAYDVTSSRLVDLPIDLDFEVLCDGQKMQMNQVLTHCPLPARVKVIEHVTNVDDVTGHVFVVKGVVSSPYLVCSSVSAGWVDHSGLLVVPDARELKFKIGIGLRGASEEEWVDFVGMLRRSVRHQLDQSINGYPGIIFQELERDELEHCVEQSKRNLPAYTNVVVDYTDCTGLFINNQYQVDTIRPKADAIYENTVPNRMTSKEPVEDWDGYLVPAPLPFSTQASPPSSYPPSSNSAILAYPPATSQQRELVVADDAYEALSEMKDFEKGNNFKNAFNKFQKRFSNKNKDTNGNNNNISNKSKLASDRSQLLQNSHQLQPITPRPPPPTHQSPGKTQPIKPPTQPNKPPAVTTNKSSPSTPTGLSSTSSTIPDDFQIPDDITRLSSTEVEKCLKLIGLADYCRDLRGCSIDGRALSNMDSKELEKHLNMSPFDAAKLARFIRGWRP